MAYSTVRKGEFCKMAAFIFVEFFPLASSGVHFREKSQVFDALRLTGGSGFLVKRVSTWHLGPALSHLDRRSDLPLYDRDEEFENLCGIPLPESVTYRPGGVITDRPLNSQIFHLPGGPRRQSPISNRHFLSFSLGPMAPHHHG